MARTTAGAKSAAAHGTSAAGATAGGAAGAGAGTGAGAVAAGGAGAGAGAGAAEGAGAAAVRAAIRRGDTRPTAGLAPGHTQANMVSVPRDWAYDVLLFCQRNPKPCPVLDVTDPGATSTVLAPGADLRTDLPAYRVWEHGELTGEPAEVGGLWRDDLVTFLIGCSFTFEWALADAGVPLRHIEQGRNVAMYVTDRECRSAGAMRGPTVVSMRPVPEELVETAARITGRMPAVHGAPVHSGDPSLIGISDLGRPDFGDPTDMHPGDVPVFWACGVTPQAAVTASRPPFAITHAPGRMLITDVRDEEYLVR
ncbi:putative hydro-lyase [Streptomyces sp. HNM0575]|uniref:putative hydro-lyase n=1 Tax=Streptomyces sp. HNM0575 TaxID=2716338 RepID=UPI00145F1ED2|nr:putative hydro-lyase [Streptomyces sp. HNM0575]NLU75979.1 putative hydro-lyase [Streptomyces sp. HNM0575]